ncbi:MAG: hypothetical protein LBE38_08670 [Deltaproteobacteria bacterium]|nr:hypothetical protein [Deltaproteobacteria bacterium]
MRHFALFLFFTMGFLVLPTGKALATCDCISLSGIVNSAAERVIAGIWVPLDAVIREAASFEVTNIRQDLTALREAVLLTKESLEASIRAADANSANREIDRTYEPASQPVTSCGLSEMGAGLQLSNKSRQVVIQDILERLLTRGERYSRPLDYQEELRDASWPGKERAAQLIGNFGGPKTLTVEETGELSRFLESLSNPIPASELSEEQADTPGAKIYLTQKKDFESRQAIYQAVLAKVASLKIPTVEGLESWAIEKWNDMGGDGPPPGVTEGLMSQEALFWFLANMRLASANWHEEVIPTLPEAGLLRELVSMEAIQLELLRRQNETLESIELMLALGGLTQLEGLPRQSLAGQYARAVGKPN